MKKICWLSLLLFDIVLEGLDKVLRQAKKTKKTNELKRRNKRAIFTNNMIVYIGNPKNHEP